MKTTHPETTIEQLKAECALAAPFFDGRAATAAAMPTQAAPTAFDLLPDDQKLAFIGAVMQEIEATAANQLTSPTSAAPGVTKTATIPQMSAGNSAYIEAQRRKFGNFRAR